jgi:hypothetical protein
MDAPTVEDARGFAFAEWQSLRERSTQVLQACWRLEAGSLAAFAAFYSWYFARAAPPDLGDSWVRQMQEKAWADAGLAMVPLIFSILVIHRLKIEYSVLFRLSEYLRKLEYVLYSKSARGFPEGWVTYLNDGHSAESLGWTQVMGRYRGTFIAAISTFVVTLCIFGATIWQNRYFLQLD